MTRRPRSATEEVESEYQTWVDHLAEIEQAFAESMAIRGGGSHPRMAIKSGELSDPKAGRWRVTYFGPDGPHGHITRDTDKAIAEEVRQSLSPPYVPMTDDEVMEWTSTQEYEKGSKITAYVQAENLLRYQASRAGRNELADMAINGANEVGTKGGTVNTRGKPYDGDALDEALGILSRALREMPQQNPGRGALVRNPPWVTRAIASTYDFIDRQVPPEWLPQLAGVRKGHKSSVVANLIEYGCGAYGCVIATHDQGVVIKITSDQSEAEFAGRVANDLVAPICVIYHMVIKLSAKRDGRQIYLLWRESAEHVGKMQETLKGADGRRAAELVDTQHRAGQDAFSAYHEDESPDLVRAAIARWKATCEAMARGPVQELRALGRGMVEVYERQLIVFGDVHIGNLGLVTRDGVSSWVITDPGNIAVVGEHNPAGKQVSEAAFRGTPVAPERDDESDEGYIYHATNVERAHDIAADGKLKVYGPSYGTDQSTWPDGTREKRSYWSRRADVVWQFAPEGGRPAVLRVHENDVDSRLELGTGDVVITKSVPSSKLQIKTDVGWEQLGTDPVPGNGRRRRSSVVR